jgi:tripartite-type tricarboxylate transporter receptor subunit TctC
MKKFVFTLSAMLAATLLVVHPVFAADWVPEKDFTWVVGYPPGGSVDFLTRLAAKKLSEKTGRAVVVDNRPGANGVIAMQAVAKGATDGYTIISIGGPVVSKNFVPEFGKDLTAVALIATAPMVLVAPSTSKVRNAAELFAEIKKTPSTWSFGSSGAGSPQHLAGELVNSMLGTDMVHVAYRGGGPAVNDVIGGQIPLAILGPSTVLPFIKAGRLKPLAVTSKSRSDVLPQVPTFSESGLSGFDATQWVAVAVPFGVARDKATRIHELLSQIIASPEMQQALVTNGMSAGQGSLDSLRDFFKADTDKWKTLVLQRKLLLE